MLTVPATTGVQSRLNVLASDAKIDASPAIAEDVNPKLPAAPPIRL
jgi:hypothetical protein